MENSVPYLRDHRRMSKSELAERLGTLQAYSGPTKPTDAHEAELQTVLHELEVYQIELEMQVRELQDSRYELEDSRNRYVNLYDFAPTGYVTMNERGVIKEINLTAAGMLGVERRWLIGRSLSPWVSSADLPVFRSHLKRCRENDGNIKSTFNLLNKSKQVMPVELSTSSLTDPSTGDLVFRTVITDLTDRRRAEADLDRFFNISSDLLCMIGSDGVFKRINPACERILGYTAQELIGRRFIDFIHPDDRSMALATKLTPGPDGIVLSDFQIRYLTKDRTEVWLSWNAMVSDDIYFCVARDVSVQVRARTEAERQHNDLRKVKESLSEAVAKLELERDLREQFVSTLTHDLRTPLTSAKISGQLLVRRAGDPAQTQKLGGQVIKSVERIDHMIQDLLDANRIRAGEKLPLRLSEFDLTQLMKTTLEELSLVHGKRFVFNAEQPACGIWDKHAIRRVLENLANNAIKYGGDNQPVNITLSESGDRMSICVQNSGNPIPEEDQLTLFQQYRRARGAEKGKKKGWGLGLTLVKGIVEAHGGQVKVESNIQSGTTFSIELPKI